MSNNKINEFLGFQKQIDEKSGLSEVQKIIIEANEKVRDNILSRSDVDDWLKELVVFDYDEFMEVYKQVMAEKGDDMTLDDVRPLVPDNNIWFLIIKKIKKPAGSIGEEDMERILEDLSSAKKNNQIN